MLAPSRLCRALTLLGGLALVLLGGCTRSRDTFSPQIVITRPAAGAFLPSDTSEVRFQVMDDQGVDHVYVSSAGGPVDLLAGAFKAQRGRKLVRLGFQAKSTDSGTVAYEIRAVDVSGRESRRELPLTVDTVAPSVVVTELSADGDTLTIAGRATDNLRVARVFVNGTPLNVSPGQTVDFYATIPRARTVEVVVQDSAGKRRYETYRAPR